MTNTPRQTGTHAESVRAKADSDNILLQAINAASQAFTSTLKSAVDKASITAETAAIHAGIYQENVFEVPQIPDSKNFALPPIPASEQEFRAKLAIADGVSSALAASEFNRARDHSPDLPSGELSATAKQKGKDQTVVIEAYVAAELAFNKLMFHAAIKGRT